MRRRSFGFSRALCCVAALLILQPFVYAKSVSQGVRLEGRDILGTAVGIGGRMAGRSRPFRLIVERITTGDDVMRLNEALRNGGQDDLLRTLSRMKAGRIQIGNNVGVPANAIIVTPEADGGLRVIVLYERDVTLYERRYGTRSEDYKFGYAELFIDRRNRGEGTFIPAARVRLRDGNTWEVEDFGVFPARIMGVQVRGGAGRAR